MNWEELLLDKTIDESWKIFEDILNDLCEKYVPTITKKNRRYKIPLPKEVRDLIKQKDKLSRKEKELRKQGRYADANKIRKEYASVRNKVRKETRTSRKNMEQALAKNTKLTQKRYSHT